MARKIEVVATFDPKGYQRGLRSAAKSTSGFGSAVKKVGLIAAATAVGGLAAVAVGLKKSVDAAKEAEVSQKRLETQLGALDLSYDKHGATIDKTLQKQSMLSAFDDEELADSFTNLVRLTGDVNKALELNAVAADIARGKGKELEFGTMAVTKAQMGQLGALKRQGIEIDKVTTAQDSLGKNASKSAIEQAKAADLVATKQAAVALLTEKFAGQSKAFGETAAGAQQRLGVAFENLGEVVGAKLIPHLVPLVNGLADFITRVAESEKVAAVLSTAGEVIGTVISGIKTAFQTLAEAAERNWPRIKKAAENVATWYRDNLEPTITSVFNNVKKAFDDSGESSQRSVRERFGGIPPIFQNMMLQSVRIVNVGLALLRGDWSKAFDELRKIPVESVKAVIDTFKMLGSGLLAAGKAAGSAAMSGLASGFSSGWTKVSEFVSSIPGKIKAWFAGAGTWLVGAGASVIGGLWSGMASAWGGLVSWATSQASGLVDSIKKRLMFWESPPETFGKKLTMRLVDGMIEGFRQQSSAMNEKSREIVRGVIDAAVAAIEEKEGVFGSAFDGLVAAATSAFDKVSSDFETKTEKKIREQDTARRDAELRVGVQSAREGLRTAEAGGDPTAILAAKKQLADAEFAMQRASDEALAEQERKDYEAKRERQRFHLEDRLAKLRENFLQGEITAQQFTKRMQQVLDKANIPLQNSAARLGLALAAGLNEAKADARNAAKALAAEIVNQLGNISVSVRVHVARTDAPDSDRGGKAFGGPVFAGHTYPVGERGPEVFTPHTSGSIVPSSRIGGGGNVYLTVNVSNPLGTPEQIGRVVQEAAADFKRRNGASLI